MNERSLSPLEQKVAAMFGEILARPSVGLDDDFFVLGGHSLLAAQLTARLGKEFGREIPLRVMFEQPTIARLAAWMGSTAEPELPELRIEPRNPNSPAPLSLMQQRVWYLEQLQPGRTVFNVPSAHRLRGELDLPALRRALADMIDRQPVLRTYIGEKDGEPVQMVLGALDSPLECEVIAGDTQQQREAALAQRLDQEVALPFFLERAPLFKIRLFQLERTDHVLFFMAHHAIWDGWSFDLFYEELAHLYAAHAEGRALTLSPLRVDYADFSAWHRRWMDGPELERQVRHWKGKLDGAEFALNLPVDRPRPVRQSGQGDTVWLRLPVSTAEALRAHANQRGATFFMLLLSVWAVLLRRVTGQKDLIVGTPVRGRHHPDLEPVMGFFVNALPLRLQVDVSQTFAQLLEAVRAEVLEAFGCQDVPFEHLVRVLELPRDESRFPLYQAFFSYQDARHRPARWGSLEHLNVPLFQPAAAQDVALWFLDGADGVVGGLNYNTDILRRDTAELIAVRYLELLESLAREPNRPVLDLMNIGVAEFERVRRWNDTSMPLPEDRLLGDYLTTALAAGGDRVAVRFEGEDWRYSQLASAAASIASALRSRGLVSGDVVGIHLDRSPRMLAAMIGVLQAGGCYLPLDPNFPAARIEFMLADARARLLIVEAGSAPIAADRTPRLFVQDALAHKSGPETTTSSLTSPNQPAYMIYTSGSTGTPKGVVVPHRAVVNFLESMRREPGLRRESRLAAVTTISFDIAVLELFLPLAVGAQILLVGREQATDGMALRRLLEDEKIDVMQATPSMWRLLVEAGWRGHEDFRALCGGEALPVDLAEELLGRVGELWNMYGPTETTVWSTCGRILPGQDDICIGRPIGNTQVWILDEAGKHAPIGIPGELCIGGEGVSLGYHGREELTRERFIQDPFAAASEGRLYRTGDLARWRTDGLLQHMGRSDLQVKVRGYRIELGEIEVALSRIDPIEQAVVVPVATAAGDVRLVAHLLWRGTATLDSNLIRERLRAELPEYMIPAFYVVAQRFPMTANGKVDRKALAALPTIQDGPAVIAGQAVQTPTEMLVAAVWQELLGGPLPGAQDNFLDLGGHSLLIMRAVAALESRSKVRLSPRVMVFQTLAQVAADIDREIATRLPISTGGPGTTSTPREGLLRRVLRVFKS